ncbi:hypothetical protein MnTg02_01242 [bacterium MnTg02]|nr:hypothetical protein MnTg02_01242 [bacterium MnTg02]
MTDPAVCEPKASGAMKSATAAAEPLEDPPGVCAGACGLEIGEFGGHGLAEHDAAGGPCEGHAGRIPYRAMPFVNGGTIGRRHIDRVHCVLDRDRKPPKRTRGCAGVGSADRVRSLIWRKKCPGTDGVFSIPDLRQARFDQCLGGQRTPL